MEKNDAIIKVEDAVKILTGVIGLFGFLSVVRHTGAFYSIVFLSLFSFSLYFEYRKRFFIPRWALNVVSFSVIASTFLRMSADDIVTPSLESLLILLAVKFLEDKKFRDFMQIYIISVFLLAGSSLLSLDVVFLVYFLNLIFFLTAATVMLSYYARDSAMALKKVTAFKIALNSLLISIISIPVTFLMFVILPRTNYPLLNFLNRAAHAGAGFTDNVRLGDVSNIQEDNSVILRVGMEKIDERLLYWRGVVLDYFDGVSWKSSGRAAAERNAGLNIEGRRVEQTIYLEPYENRYLFALDKPVALYSRNMERQHGLTYARNENVMKRIKYQAVSALSGEMTESVIDRQTYLQLPKRNMSKIGSLVKTLASGADREAYVKNILEFLRNGGYRYSLKNLPVSKEPLEDFLFSFRYGNCEYFASAMAVMLRSAGIPARLVGGYRGGYYNEVGKYYVIPQRNAHVWVEAYLDNRWVRADPTPAGIEEFAGLARSGIFFRIKLFFDTVNYYWNASVINYDFEEQVSLLRKMNAQLRKPDINMAAVMRNAAGFLIFIAAAFLCIFAVYHTTSNRKSPEEKIIAAFLKRMKKLGCLKTKSEGLEEFVSKIENTKHREKAHKFTKEFQGFYYMDKKIASRDARNLKRLIEDI